MRVEQQPAFVLHARAWRETSLLLDVLSRDHGRVGLVARGVRAARSRTPRALLQPMSPLLLSWSGRGELATLNAAESAGAVLRADGEALLCALYLNELIARMLTRHDPHPALFADYATVLARLTGGDSPAWALRRFERDLLAHLGYGLILDREADSAAPIDPQRDYAWHFEHGAVAWRGSNDGPRVRGSALLALAADRMPAADDLSALRRLLRAVIARHLDGGRLRAWGLLSAAQFRVDAPD